MKLHFLLVISRHVPQDTGILEGWMQSIAGARGPAHPTGHHLLGSSSHQLLDQYIVPWPGLGKLSQESPFPMDSPTPTPNPEQAGLPQVYCNLCARTWQAPRLRVGRLPPTEPPTKHPRCCQPGLDRSL